MISPLRYAHKPGERFNVPQCRVRQRGSQVILPRLWLHVGELIVEASANHDSLNALRTVHADYRNAAAVDELNGQLRLADPPDAALGS